MQDLLGPSGRNALLLEPQLFQAPSRCVVLEMVVLGLVSVIPKSLRDSQFQAIGWSREAHEGRFGMFCASHQAGTHLVMALRSALGRGTRWRQVIDKAAVLTGVRLDTQASMAAPFLPSSGQVLFKLSQQANDTRLSPGDLTSEDNIGFNSVMASQSRWQKALDAMSGQIQQTCLPDIIGYNALVTSCAQSATWSSAYDALPSGTAVPLFCSVFCFWCGFPFFCLPGSFCACLCVCVASLFASINPRKKDVLFCPWPLGK